MTNWTYDSLLRTNLEDNFVPGGMFKPFANRRFTTAFNNLRGGARTPWAYHGQSRDLHFHKFGKAYMPPRSIVVGIAGIAILLSIYPPAQQAFAEAPDTPVLPPSPDRSQSNSSTCSVSSMRPVSYDASEKNINGAKDEFRNLLGSDRVSDELALLISKSSTEWSTAPGGELDRFAVIVSPNTTEEVSKIAMICHRRRIPMIAFSGGTSLEGTLAAVHGGVCIDFRLMNKIIEVRKADLDVTVQPAVGYEELNSFIAKDKLFFPPDPGPGAQIGGMISQGCSGTNAFHYGTMKDWVLGLTIVLADGTIVKTRGRPRKSSSGYDLTRILVGSEGTLGLVTEAHLKLTDKPENERIAVAAFPSTRQAVDVAIKVVQSGMPISAMELLCDLSMKAVNIGGYCEKQYPEVPTVFFKFAGRDKDYVQRQIEAVERFAQESNCKTFEFSSSQDEADAIWAARKTVLWSMLATKDDSSDGFASSDTAVPISQLGTAIDSAKKKINESGFKGYCLGHVGDGNFHTGIIYPAGQEKKARELINWVQRLAIKLDGTVTGEHGIGVEYRDELVEELGGSSIDLMRQLKLAMDPLCLLNPDKIFRLNIDTAPKKH